MHDIGAHLAGVYEEVVRHVQAYAAGSPLTSTRSFEEREAPFKELSPDELLAFIDGEEEHMRQEIYAVINKEPEATLWWTGRWMRVDAFLSHLRNECALHRWDMVGDDEIGVKLLATFDLFKHAVTNIGSKPLCGRGVEKYGDELSGLEARIRTEGQSDLHVTVSDTVPTWELVDPSGEPTVIGDQGARTLLLWGRSPTPATRLEAVGPHDTVVRLRRLLSGY